MSNCHASKQHGMVLAPRLRPKKKNSLKAARDRARIRKEKIWASVKNKKQEAEKQLATIAI